MSDEPKLRYQGDWEKIKHIAKIIETEYENESMALWAAEAIFQYVNENPAVSVHYIRREKAKAWDEGASAAATELDGPEYWLPGEDDFPNPYRK